MKIQKLIYVMVIFFMLTKHALMAQPPDPPGDPSIGGDPIPGGDAPLGSGATVLLVMAAAYGYNKYRLQLKKSREWQLY